MSLAYSSSTRATQIVAWPQDLRLLRTSPRCIYARYSTYIHTVYIYFCHIFILQMELSKPQLGCQLYFSCCNCLLVRLPKLSFSTTTVWRQRRVEHLISKSAHCSRVAAALGQGPKLSSRLGQGRAAANEENARPSSGIISNCSNSTKARHTHTHIHRVCDVLTMGRVRRAKEKRE